MKRLTLFHIICAIESFTISGGGLGFLLWLMIVWNGNESLADSIWYFIIIGAVLGFALSLIYLRMESKDESWRVASSSPDLDDFKFRQPDLVINSSFQNEISSFSNKDLITALTLRYYRLSDESTQKLIEEIKHRNISLAQIEKAHRQIKPYVSLRTNHCPCCQSKKHLLVEKGNIEKCIVCGYDRAYDNPKSFANRIRWKLGFLSVTKLPLSDMITLLKHRIN